MTTSLSGSVNGGPPMGLYTPVQLVHNARAQNAQVCPVSVNHSFWDCISEPRQDGALALRLGFRQIKGMREEDAVWISTARENAYADVERLWRSAGMRPDVVEPLAEADAFAALGLNRCSALWDAKALQGPAPLPLFGADGEGGIEPVVTLPQIMLGNEVIEDCLSRRLLLRAHRSQICGRDEWSV